MLIVMRSGSLLVKVTILIEEKFLLSITNFIDKGASGISDDAIMIDEFLMIL